MHFITLIALLATTIISAEALLRKKRPTSVFGVCNRIETFYRPEQDKQDIGNQEGSELRLKNQPYTSIHWRVAKGNVVVKFKIGLQNLCSNLSQVMGRVEEDLQRMMFKTSDIKSRRNREIGSGVCNKIGTFYTPKEDKQHMGEQEGSEIRLRKQSYTSVHWRVAKGNVVVKFKVALKNLCINFSKVMGGVAKDLHRMLFKKSDTKSRRN